MKKSKAVIGIILLKSAFLLAFTELIAHLANYIFVSNLFGEEYFSARVMNIIYTVVFFMIFNSLVIALNYHDRFAMKQYLEKTKSGNRATVAAKYIVTNPDYYVEIALLAVVSLILPTDFMYGFAANAFFGDAEVSRFYTIIIIIVIMFALDFAARIVVAKNWYSDRKRLQNAEKEKFPPTIKRVFFVALIYCAAAITIAWVLPFFISINNFGDGRLYVWVILAIILIAIIAIAIIYIRALSKRIKFVKKLKKYCTENAIFISKINKSYSSVFKTGKDGDFRLEKDGKIYDCRLLSGIFPGSPITLSDKGDGIIKKTVRLFHIELFHIMSKFDFSIDGDEKKIIIFSPTPKQFFASVQGGSPRIADNGEKVGEYTIYAGSAFLNALDRNDI